MPEQIPKLISKETQFPFNIDKFGLYAISISAICSIKNDLRVEIDNKLLRELPPEKNIQKYNIPPAWNGTKLKGLIQTNIFLLQLNKGEHNITFFPKNEAIVESWKINLIKDSSKIEFSIEQQAEDGDKRPWFTFSLIDLPIKSITAKASVFWHFWDGDDIKLIVDNKIENNTNSRLWKDWVWHATTKQLIFGTKQEQKTFETNLDTNIHYIEIWADRTPTLHNITFNLGDFVLKRIPTVDDPEWTGDFADDTDQMILARLIFGEAKNQTKEAMTGVGWTVKNRLKAKRKYFGFSYNEIILKNDGIYWQFSPLDPDEKDNFPLLINPLQTDNALTINAWHNAYNIALDIINGNISDPTNGATFFHSSDLSQEFFTTQSVPGAIFKTQIDKFLFYKDPNEN